MSDLAIAGLLIAFPITLAITAPFWGYNGDDLRRLRELLG